MAEPEVTALAVQISAESVKDGGQQITVKDSNMPQNVHENVENTARNPSRLELKQQDQLQEQRQRIVQLEAENAALLNLNHLQHQQRHYVMALATHSISTEVTKQAFLSALDACLTLELGQSNESVAKETFAALIDLIPILEREGHNHHKNVCEFWAERIRGAIRDPSELKETTALESGAEQPPNPSLAKKKHVSVPDTPRVQGRKDGPLSVERQTTQIVQKKRKQATDGEPPAEKTDSKTKYGYQRRPAPAVRPVVSDEFPTEPSLLSMESQRHLKRFDKAEAQDAEQVALQQPGARYIHSLNAALLNSNNPNNAMHDDSAPTSPTSRSPTFQRKVSARAVSPGRSNKHHGLSLHTEPRGRSTSPDSRMSSASGWSNPERMAERNARYGYKTRTNRSPQRSPPPEPELMRDRSRFVNLEKEAQYLADENSLSRAPSQLDLTRLPSSVPSLEKRVSQMSFTVSESDAFAFSFLQSDRAVEEKSDERRPGVLTLSNTSGRRHTNVLLVNLRWNNSETVTEEYVNATAPLMAWFEAMALKASVSVSQLEFKNSFGAKLQAFHTPEQANLRDGDWIMLDLL